jgi:hypothetical protein
VPDDALIRTDNLHSRGGQLPLPDTRIILPYLVRTPKLKYSSKLHTLHTPAIPTSSPWLCLYIRLFTVSRISPIIIAAEKEVEVLLGINTAASSVGSLTRNILDLYRCPFLSRPILMSKFANFYDLSATPHCGGMLRVNTGYSTISTYTGTAA